MSHNESGQKNKKNKIALTWKIENDDLRNQIENYNTLKITQSYRGLSVLLISASLVLGLVLSFITDWISTEDVLYGLIIYIPVIVFAYRGHRWAIIGLMILWTLEKGIQLFDGQGAVTAIIWWLIFMPIFYKALKVENERRKLMKQQSPQVLEDKKSFCQHCGSLVEREGRFCSSCGKSLT